MTNSIDELTASMNGKPTTDGWDVVCSYTVASLNSFLTAQYDANRLAKQVQVSVDEVDPLTESNYTITFDVKFGSPKLSFVAGTSGFARLTIPIVESTYSVKAVDGPAKPSKPLPNAGKYSIEVTAPLVGLQGDGTDAVVEPGQVIEFSDTTAHDNHVVIHFKNSQAHYEIVPPPAEGSAEKVLLRDKLLALKDYFMGLKEVDYALATVNNTAPDAESPFVPKSFVFATSGVGDSAALSLYIQTNSGSAPGAQAPTFKPGDLSRSPIPDGYSASLILAHSLITKAFLEPQLKASGFSVEFTSPVEANSGISVTLKKEGSVVAKTQAGTYQVKENDQVIYLYTGLDISLSQKPLRLHIRDGQITLEEWKAGEQLSVWMRLHAGLDTTSISHLPNLLGVSEAYGNVKVNISLKKDPVKLSLRNDEEVVGYRLTISASDFEASCESQPCSFKDRVAGCKEALPDYYNNLPLTVPSIEIALQGFNFFRTTNLLAPGQHVIDVDEAKGVQTPHDFLIVGNVVQKK